MTITVTRRSHDYHACITGETGKWGCGRTSEAAVSDLRRAWTEAQDLPVRPLIQRG